LLKVDYSPDELIVTCISRQIRNGDLVAQGIATPLVAVGYLLARCTHAPDLSFISAIGQSLCQEPAPIGLARVEALWLENAVARLGFVAAVTELLPRTQPKEFFRPGQMDATGNFNNVAIGKNHTRPLLRLPGTGGIPDVTTYGDGIYLYVPRHSRVTFVERLDFLSGLGHNPARTRGRGPCYLITDLGQFDFASDRMRLVTNHPGVTVARGRDKTGVRLEISADLHETPPPTAEELRLLREEIDPLRVRRLELLSGPARKELLREILEKEGAL